MQIENLNPEVLWQHYQRGYHCLVRSGLYFRQVLRPALSHVYFQRAVPLLVEYARANHTNSDLPPGFGDQLHACPLTPRDLLHLDYAICLGYAEAQGNNQVLVTDTPVMSWPGPGGSNGIFIAADAVIAQTIEALYGEMEWDEEEAEEGETESEDPTDEDSKPPFDL